LEKLDRFGFVKWNLLNFRIAGETLHFSIEVAGVRGAKQKELSHGHTHGEGEIHY
tara:strand:- start:233 stop:397 length:165 start_codon:yes stop_codon:yes gene_type:complete